MKKHFKFAAAFMSLLMLGATAACGDREGITSDNWEISSTSGEAKQVTLKFTHIWPEHSETFKMICDNFEKQNSNVKIQINVKNYANIDQSLTSSWGSSQFPDVSFYWTHGMTNLVNKEVKMAADITEIYYEAHKNEFIGDGECFVSGVIDDKVYNVPFRATGFVVYYNKTIFDDLGISVPKTLEEFETVLAEIKDKSDFTPLSCWGATGTYSYIAGALGTYYDIISGRSEDPNFRTDRLTMNDKEMDNRAYIFEKVRNWTKLGYFGSNPLAGSTESVESEFLNETCAMAMLNNNSLDVIRTEMESEVGCISLPAYSSMEDPEAGYVSGGYDGFFISNSSKNKAWALKFLEYLNSTEAQQLFADNERSVMSRKDVVYTDELQASVAKCMKNIGVMGAFADYALSSSATASAVALNNYTVNKSGSFEACRKLVVDMYNAKKSSVEDIMINPAGLKMIEPTYTEKTEELEAFMNWVKFGKKA